jgi:pyruvate/2-oxoglutarate/acetoin dehydrogenase E1 component
MEKTTLKYFDELKRTMEWLGSKSDTLFLGQAVAFPGTAMFNTVKDINPTKLLEMPVAEEFQMGVSVGLAMAGTFPISIYPRWNFLLLATSQIVNHLDKLHAMNETSSFKKVIIRTSVGSEHPLHPGHQHVGDFSEAYKIMCKNMNVVLLNEPEEIFPEYQKAYERNDGVSTILVEWGDFYNSK